MAVVFPTSCHSLTLWPLPFLPNCDLIIYFNDKHSTAPCTVRREGHYAALSPACPLSEPYISIEQPAFSLTPLHPGDEDGPDLVPGEMLF